jgi:enoyl-CoA hydratase/carnithine racemase
MHPAVNSRAPAQQRPDDGQTLILTISNPEFTERPGPDIYAAGVEALNAAENNPDMRSVVITGEGAIFCAGGNLQRLQANRREPREVQAQSIEGLHNWIDSIRTYPKPVIAAVEGAGRRRRFFAGAGLRFHRRGRQRGVRDVLQHSRAVARRRRQLEPWRARCHVQLASELLMTGERIGPRRLHDLGLVNRVTAPGEALEALQLADRLNARAPNALASIKELINDAAGNTLNQQLASEQDHFVRNLHDANAGEGIDAFLNKRTPHYR